MRTTRSLRRRPSASIGSALAVAVLVLASSCGDDDADSNGESPIESVGVDGETTDNAITGTVNEWSVSVDEPSAPPGEVTFEITNDGTVQHEFLVVRTDVPDGSIPLDGDHFSEDDESIEVVDEIPEFSAGSTEVLTVDLEPGTYQLVCNLPGHYANGMHTSFDVSGD